MTSTGRRGFVGIDRHWLTELDPTLIVLMLWLDSHSDEYLRDLHVLRIAKEIGWSRNRVTRNLDELVRLGFVSTEQVVDHRSGSRTRITLHQSVWTRDPDSCAPSRSTDPDSCAPSRSTAVLHGETQAVLHGGAPTTSNPTIEESTSRSASRGAHHIDETSAVFAEFYMAYPRHVGREAAMKSWKRMTAPERRAAITSLPLHIDLWKREGRGTSVIPYPATWLNGKRWEDEIEFRPSIAPQTRSEPKGTGGLRALAARVGA